MENTHITNWFNNWDLTDREYTATDLYNDYKAKKGNGFCVSLIHFSKLLALLARQSKLLTRSKNGKTLYYNPVHTEEVAAVPEPVV